MAAWITPRRGWREACAGGWGRREGWGAGSAAWFRSGCPWLFPGSAPQVCHRGAPVTGARPALAPPRTCGLLLCRWRRGGLSRRRRELAGRRRPGEGGGKCSLSDQPPLPTSHCERDKTQRARSSHARTHRRPGRLSSPGAAENARLPFPAARGGSEGLARSPKPTQKPKIAGHKPSSSPACPAEAPHPPP